MCGTVGDFDISKFELDGQEIVNELQNENEPSFTYILRSKKINGVAECWNVPGYFSIAEVSVAFEAIDEFFDNEIWRGPTEGEINGSFELSVEFYYDPFKTKVILNNDGFGREEIMMIVKDFYDSIPKDKK